MIIRNMTEQELETCLEWARAEGWNPGLDDAAAFYAADAAGFFVAEVEGCLAACISVVNHCDTHSFLGLYICRPKWRGQGVGYALWQRALQHAGTRTVGLDGVPAQQENYRRSGFLGEGQTTRFMGRFARAQGRAVSATPGDLNQLCALDRRAVGYARPAYAMAWFTPSATRETRLLKKAGEITGFATFRQRHEGIKIGPLHATCAEDAIELLSACPARFAAGASFVDTSTGSGLANLLLDQGCTPVFGTARMYRGHPPEPSEPAYFAVTTLELG